MKGSCPNLKDAFETTVRSSVLREGVPLRGSVRCPVYTRIRAHTSSGRYGDRTVIP